MKKSEIKMILIIILVGLAILGIIMMFKNGKKKENNNTTVTPQNSQSTQNEAVEEYVQKFDDGTKVNISEQLSQTKKLDGLEITNIQLRSGKGSTQLFANVKNTTSRTSTYRKIKIEALDKNGKVLTDFVGAIDNVAPGETVELNAWVAGDVANAYDFRVSNM